MKHSKKLQETHNTKFSCFLACFGGGQPSGKKLTFDHSKKGHHHHHRWLLSPYWSKVRLKRSTPGSKTVPFELFGMSSTPSVASNSSAGGKTAEYENIPTVEKADQQTELISKVALQSSNHKIPTFSEDGVEEICQKAEKPESKRSSKTSSSTELDKSCMPEKPSNNASMQASRLDPIVGLLIVILTFLIMIIWGRLCAILCTSAWFYFVPMFYWKEGKNKSQNVNFDEKFENEDKSWRMKDYKQRVVLKGFLERENVKSFNVRNMKEV